MTSSQEPINDDAQMEKSGTMMIESVEDLTQLDTIEDTKPGAFVWLCAAAAAIGGLLFGCEFLTSIAIPVNGSQLTLPFQTTLASSQAS